jgi:predicted neutral ceramidase superfamily lipid hydrolase
MKYNDILTQLAIFLASITSTVYAIFSKSEKEALNRTLLAGKILGSVMVAFFIMPAIMEYFNLTIKMTLLITVVFAYGLESILKASVKKVIKSIDKDGEDDGNN